MVNTFSIEIAKSLVESSEQFPVNFEDAWQWLEYGTKSDAKCSFKKCNFVENLDFISFQDSSLKPLGGRPTEVIKMTVDCFKMWSMMSNTEKGKEVRLYFLECEKIAKQNQNSNLNLVNLKDIVQQTIRQELTPIQKELSELRVISTALSSSNGIQKQINAQACNDFSEYQMLTFNDVVKKFRPYFAKVPKIVSRARHSVGKVFATEQERELGKISGKYIFSGWEIQTAINCLDRAAKEIFVEYEDSTLPLMELIEKMDKENKELI